MRWTLLRSLILFSCLLVSILAVNIVLAATPIDLTTAGSTVMINGAIFEAFDPSDPIGGGTFVPFVRISSSNPVIRGYNTDYRPVQFDEDTTPSNTLSRLLSEIPQYMVSGTLYREIQLDINQDITGDDYLLSLDTLELYESSFISLCGYPFDGSGGGHTGCITDNTATLIWDMDALEDSFVILDHRNNNSANRRDLRVLVPDAIFWQAPNCSYAGTGCTVYVTIYSQFGGDQVCPRANQALTTCPNNDGHEDWGVRHPDPTAITLLNLTAGVSNSQTISMAVGISALAILTLLFIVIRVKQRDQNR